MARVEVCYAENSKDIFFAAIMIADNATVKDVICSCGVLAEYPSIDLENITVGVNSKKASLDTIVKTTDRIVILRPLKIMPQEARRLRAKKNKIK